MFALLKSIFYSPPLSRKDQIQSHIEDLGDLNYLIQKYDYYFNNNKIKESLPFTWSNPQLYIGHNDSIITTSNNPKSGIFIKIWDPKTLYLIYNYEGPPRKFLLSLPNSQILVGSNSNAEIIDITKNTVITTLGGHKDNVISAILHPDGRIITRSHDLSIKVWILANNNNTSVCQFTLENYKPINLMIVSKCENKLIIKYVDFSLCIWNLSSGICEHEFLGQIDINGCDGSEIYLSSIKDIIICKTPTNIEIWDIETGIQEIFLISRANIIVTGDKIIYIACDNSLQIYDLNTKQVIETIPNPLKPIRGFHLDNFNTTSKAIRLLPDNSILNLSKDNRLSIWDPMTKKYRIHPCAYILRLEVLSDGKIVMISNNRLELWN